ncbi:MAG: hypothetical protein H6Q20_2139 [Bacteroidetes bacterium]|jgi:hypothetical protein|nr:hypothetical protein [Bacteroidota bacterium]
MNFLLDSEILKRVFCLYTNYCVLNEVFYKTGLILWYKILIQEV